MCKPRQPLPAPILCLCSLVFGCGSSGETSPPGNAPTPTDGQPSPPPVEAVTGDAAVGASEPETPSTPEWIDEPSTANAGDATCAVGEQAVLEAGSKRLQSLEVGFGPRGGLIAWPRGKQLLAVEPLDLAGGRSGEVATVEIPGARRLHGVTALGDALVVTTHDLCPDEKYFHKCLHALALDAGGKPRGGVATEVTAEWIRSEFHERIGPDEVWLLRSHMYVDPVINSLRLARDGGIEIGSVERSVGGGGMVWGKGFAVKGREWYVVIESEEGTPSIVSNAGERRRLGWLPAVFEVLGFERREDGLVLLFAPMLPSGKRGRPRLARLGVDGKPVGKPRKIDRGEPLPAPFDERVEAVFEKRGKDLIFRRTDAAGDPLGDSVVVAPFPGGSRDEPRLALGWTGDRFVAVWSSFEDGQWKIRSAAISCGGTV